MGGLLETLLADESYRPSEPRSLAETGLSQAMLEQLILKYLLAVGARSGRDIADKICLPYGLIEDTFQSLRQRQLLIHSGAAQLNDYTYGLTDQGMMQARRALDLNSYVGPAPVPLVDYVLSVEAQTVRAEAVKRYNLEKAFEGISVERTMFEILGPAINSGAGLFMYGEPGNGKTTLAKRITRCFGQEIWIPYV
ncbi:MAG: AAA family ATPase, partial [Planctomycetales bacterium]|nr:AAA family ATPase [Planctomycetales bacterium]